MNMFGGGSITTAEYTCVDCAYKGTDHCQFTYDRSGCDDDQNPMFSAAEGGKLYCYKKLKAIKQKGGYHRDHSAHSWSDHDQTHR